MKQITILITAFLFPLAIISQSNFTDDPNKVNLHTKDIALFWNVFDGNYPNFTPKIWDSEYLKKGSIGLRNFIPNRIENGRKLNRTIKKNLSFYQSIRENTLSITSQKNRFKQSFFKLKLLYPEAVFPDVYFVIGRNSSGGTIFDQGLIIGAEKFAQNSDNPFDSLDDVVAHELIHFQQNYSKDYTLLAACIKEGSADFLAEMLTGKHPNQEAHRYGDGHRTELWKEFLELKDQTNTNGWLYGHKTSERPKDLGYWLGYEICQSYYNNSLDKSKAIHNILNIEDFDDFFIKSDYHGTKPASRKLSIEINKNIELLGIGYFLGFEGVDIENKTVEIDGKTIPKKEWHSYGYEIFKQFEHFGQSEHLLKAFMVADHLWLDYLSAFLLQLDDVPHAKITDSVNEKYYLNFSKEHNKEEARKNAQTFVDGLNAFALEIDFDTYMRKSKPYYVRAKQEIMANLSHKGVVTAMENFYKNEFDSYHLVPSLTIPKGMGFGIKSKADIYSVFGAVDFQDINKLNMGFTDMDKLTELTIHEFGHSFVNPIVAKQPKEMFDKSEHLFKALKSSMASQGYNTWKVCLYEHFVRAGEIIIAEKTGELDRAERLKFEYINKRNFIYIPEILDELRSYEHGEYESYDEVVKKILLTLSKK